ncbi:MAG TPA: hypothetical protein VGU43_04320 [Thermoplasmata archaeon]|nr:hypothetical protein [Thermoplasmata archaeon]
MLGDTWLFQSGAWKNVTATACGKVCPPRLAYASMAYDPADQSIVMVGGLSSTCAAGCNTTLSTVAYLWTGGSWNSTLVGPFSSPAYGIALAWDERDNCLLAFGGSTQLGPVSYGNGIGESSCFNSGTGTWTLGANSSGPPARWGAGMANLTTGSVLLFGGESVAGPLGDTWEYSSGNWSPVVLGGAAPPAREFGSLEESPAAALGAVGSSTSAILVQGQAQSSALNDTWLFSSSPPSGGTAFGNWTPDTTLPSPPAAWGAAGVSDFTDGFVLTFGGYARGLFLGSTWAYFHPVVTLTASSAEFRASTTDSFVARAAGGQGPYTYAWTGLPDQCAAQNLSVLNCTPTGFGIYDVRVSIVDTKGRTATANMTVQVDPESTVLEVSSLYESYFYTGVSLSNTFGVVCSVWGGAPQQVTGSLPGAALTFSLEAGGGWNATTPMANVTPGGELELAIGFSNWTVHSTFPVKMVETPGWMQSFLEFPGNLLFFQPGGSGPWNHSYSYSDEMGWSLASLIAFSIPVPGFAGGYALLPTSLVHFTFDSNGSVNLSGQISTEPSITIGSVTLSASYLHGKGLDAHLEFFATINISGAFSLTPLSPGAYTVHWNSTTASLTLKLKAELPPISIFPAAIPEGTVGLTAVISVDLSVMLAVILGPGSPGNSNFLPDLSIVLQDLVVHVSLEFGLTIQVGVEKLFEVGAKGTLGIAAIFQTLVPHVLDLWVNASVGGFVQFLCFTIAFDLWKGTIYNWSSAPTALPVNAPMDGIGAGTVEVPWNFAPRYYNTSTYNRVTWNPSEANGTALENVYPQASPVISAGGSSATVAYTSDDVAVNQTAGLSVAAFGLDPVSHALTASTVPSVPGSVSFAPQVLSGADGSSTSVFSSVPISQLASRVPGNVKEFDLESSSRPTTGAWSSPRLLQDWGYPISYLLDACGASASPTAAVLVAPSINPQSATPERLIEYTLANGGIVSNASVTGLANLGGFDCAGGWVSASTTSGNVSLYSSSTGLPIVVNVLPPAGSTLVEAVPVANGSASVSLLYRSAAGDEAIIFDLLPQTTQAVDALPGNVTSVSVARESGTFYLFAATPDEVIQESIRTGGAVEDLGPVSTPGLVALAIAPTSLGIVVLVQTATGSSAQPLDNLSLRYLALHSPPVSGGTSSPTCRVGGVSCGAADLAFGGVLVVFSGILVAVWILRPSRSRRSGAPRARDDASAAPETVPPKQDPSTPSIDPRNGEE